MDRKVQYSDSIIDKKQLITDKIPSYLNDRVQTVSSFTFSETRDPSFATTIATRSSKVYRGNTHVYDHEDTTDNYHSDQNEEKKMKTISNRNSLYPMEIPGALSNKLFNYLAKSKWNEAAKLCKKCNYKKFQF
jgi:hypothetical protein